MKMNAFKWLSACAASLLLMASAGAMPEVAPPKLKIGDPAPAIDAMAWIKGEPVKSFKPGHVYVVEFWATWCGPCNMVMPHLSELQKKHAKDLTIVGVNVRESQNGKAELAPVTQFVNKKGDKMAYTVAMDDPVKKTVFDTWMTAGGSYGIPTSFIVGRDGKLAWVGYPTAEDGYTFDQALADALAGKSDLTKARALQAEVNKGTQERLYQEKMLKPLNAARSQKDYKGVIAEVDRLAKVDPTFGTMLFRNKFSALLHVDSKAAFDVAAARAKDAELLKQNEIKDDTAYWGMVGSIIADEKDLSKDIYQKGLGYLQAATAANPDLAMYWVSQAKLQSQLGHHAQAAASQEKAIALVTAAKLDPEYIARMQKALEKYKAAQSAG